MAGKRSKVETISKAKNEFNGVRIFLFYLLIKTEQINLKKHLKIFQISSITCEKKKNSKKLGKNEIRTLLCGIQVY